MCRCFKMIVLILSIAFSLQQVAFASGETIRPPRPTEGIESSDPSHGSSTNINSESIQSGLFYKYDCTIDNTGSDLYLEVITSAFYLVDQISLTLYLQKWDGSQWVDLQSWPYTEYDSKTIMKGIRTSYEHGNYYRTRAEHNIKCGSQVETQNSTSSYIYVE